MHRLRQTRRPVQVLTRFGPRRSKYGVAPKAERTLDGITFASKKEMLRYGELLMLVKAGVITDLRLQPRYKLPADITYIADFEYRRDGALVAEDVKGYLTPEYKLKRKLFRASYPEIVHLET